MRLVLHIGLGKTGTTAFQRFCHANQRPLGEAGYLFAGMYLRNVAPGALESQGQVARPKELARGLEQLDRVLQDAPPEAGSLLWSNEAFSMASNPAAVVQTIDDYVASSAVFDSWESYLVLRRQDQWIESAYKQWAMRHKTNPGSVKSPRAYVESAARLLDYYTLATIWAGSSGTLHACSYDEVMACGGISEYMVRRLGLDAESFDFAAAATPANESLDNDLSTLLAMYNGNFDAPSLSPPLVKAFRESGMTGASGPDDTCFVSEEIKRELVERYRESNRKLEAEFFSQGEVFNERPVDARPLYEPDPLRLLGRLLPLLEDQQRRLDRQGQRLRALERRE